MIQLIHDTPPPRLLENRREIDTPIGPTNPRKAWNSFSTQGKQDIHRQLIPLQKGLCIYCEQKLNKYGFHIEHILSKTLNPPLTFEYTNLSLSCIKNGTISDETTSNPISCGHAQLKRINQYNENLFIKPTEINSNSLFRYKNNGEITFSNEISDADIERVKHTIEVLNLDCHRLRRERREIIEKGLEIILDLKDDNDALSYFLELEFKIVNNKYVFPFISAREEHYKLFRV